MASNKKWFKRAIRSLSAGETQLWNLIKEKLPTERVEMLENQFFSSPVESEGPVEETPAKESPVVEKSPNKTREKKTTTTKKTTRKSTAKKSVTKKATKTKKNKEKQNG